MTSAAGILLFAFLIVFLLMGVPISIVLGLCAIIGAYFSNIPLPILAEKIVSALNPASGSPLMAIPFFLLAGNLMSESGISKKLILFINSFAGKTQGGLNYAAVLACALFSSLAGAAPITVIAVGSILYAEMIALGYPKARSAGLFTAAGSLGSIIPPSIIMMVYANISKVPISDLFISGAGIGIILTAVFMIICFFIAKKDNLPKNAQPFIFSDFIKSFISVLPALFIPIIIFGGIYSKLLTPLGAGAIASIYAILIGIFIYKSLNIKKIKDSFINSVQGSVMILFIVAAASAFSFVFQKSMLSASLGNFINTLNLSPTLFLVLCAIIVIIAGTIIDGAAICVLLVPALGAIAQSLAISMVHFGMIICIGAVLGSMTPPVAVSIFAAKTFSNLKIGEIVKGQMPFFIGFCIVYIMIVIFPFFSEFLLKK
ncbi:MAG: TRAP transporter large permease [Elusimicrobiota bacterium]|jgi:C4-dicarboxylate transporter DctM subunit|nr:TRAP transporter large permease [Elusimicrobiota bacterium]